MSSPGVSGMDATVKVATKDISGDGNSLKVSFARDNQDVSVFGSDWKEYIVGQASATMDFDGYYDADADKSDAQALAALAASAVTVVVVEPKGTGAGKPIYTGNAWITKYEFSTKVNSAIVFSSSFRYTGEVVKSVGA